MAFEDFKNSIRKAGSAGGGGDIVVQAKAEADTSQLSELDKMLRGISATAGTGATAAVKQVVKSEVRKQVPAVVNEAVPPPNRGFRGWVASLKKRGFIAYGSEGLRVGHVRLSRSGLSLSEKTFLGTGNLAIGAAAGQIIGTLAQESVTIREDIEKAEGVADYLVKIPLKSGARLGERVASLFGLTKIATGIIAQVSGSSWEDAEKAWNDTVRTLMGDYLKVMTEEQDAILTASVESRLNGLQRNQKLKAKRLDKWPQNPMAHADAVREDVARSYTEERIMTRDLAGRPLWKVAQIPNEGR